MQPKTKNEPGLGGALREALVTLRDAAKASGDSWEVAHEDVDERVRQCRYWRTRQRAFDEVLKLLSLSSPIEPPPNDVPCPENERSATTAEESGIRSAGNLAQASSEIREALEAVKRELNEKCIDGVPMYDWLSVGTIQKVDNALAPSRQGAGGK